MPQVSTGPFQNQVIPIAASYAFGPNDTYASLQADAAFPSAAVGGIIVSLPGYDSAVPANPVHGAAIPSYALALPSNGDFYTFADPTLQLSDSRVVTIWGGGFQLYDPFAEVLRTYITCTIPGTGLDFTFDRAAGLWIVEDCSVPVPD